jgi:hypothetical protein
MHRRERVEVASSERIASAVASGKPSRAATAPPRSQRTAIQVARDVGGARDPDQVAAPCDHAAPMPDRSRRLDGQADAIVRVDDLHPRLHHAIVRPEQRADARRARGAAGVLERERSVERRPIGGAECELVGQPHADDAGVQRVPERLSLGEVEGERERPEHIGGADPYGDRAQVRLGRRAMRDDGCGRAGRSG